MKQCPSNTDGASALGSCASQGVALHNLRQGIGVVIPPHHFVAMADSLKQTLHRPPQPELMPFFFFFGPIVFEADSEPSFWESGLHRG